MVASIMMGFSCLLIALPPVVILSSSFVIGFLCILFISVFVKLMCFPTSEICIGVFKLSVTIFFAPW